MAAAWQRQGGKQQRQGRTDRQTHEKAGSESSGWKTGRSLAEVYAFRRQSNTVMLSPNGMIRTGGPAAAAAAAAAPALAGSAAAPSAAPSAAAAAAAAETSSSASDGATGDSSMPDRTMSRSSRRDAGNQGNARYKGTLQRKKMLLRLRHASPRARDRPGASGPRRRAPRRGHPHAQICVTVCVATSGSVVLRLYTQVAKAHPWWLGVVQLKFARTKAAQHQAGWAAALGSSQRLNEARGPSQAPPTVESYRALN